MTKAPFKVGMLYKYKFTDEVVLITKIKMFDTYHWEYEYYYLDNPNKSYTSICATGQGEWITI